MEYFFVVHSFSCDAVAWKTDLSCGNDSWEKINYQFKCGLGCRQSGVSFWEIHPKPTVWQYSQLFFLIIVNVKPTRPRWLDTYLM